MNEGAIYDVHLGATGEGFDSPVSSFRQLMTAEPIRAIVVLALDVKPHSHWQPAGCMAAQWPAAPSGTKKRRIVRYDVRGSKSEWPVISGGCGRPRRCNIVGATSARMPECIRHFA